MFRCFVIILLFVMPVVVSAQPDQAFVIDAQDLAHPLTITTLNRTGRYQAKVSRQFGNEMEERLLQIAEAVYPPEHKIKETSGDDSKVDTPNERRWWTDSVDKVRIPYAITKGAVSYYLDVTAEFRKDKPREPVWEKFTESSFEYSATVTPKASYVIGNSRFSDVYVVSMRLVWWQSCGNLCGLQFTTSRTVVLSKDGKVLSVNNDGDAQVSIS